MDGISEIKPLNQLWTCSIGSNVILYLRVTIANCLSLAFSPWVLISVALPQQNFIFRNYSSTSFWSPFHASLQLKNKSTKLDFFKEHLCWSPNHNPPPQLPSPVPQNMTSFGNSVVVGVMKMRSYGRKIDTQSSMTSVLKRESLGTDMHTHGDGGGVSIWRGRQRWRWCFNMPRMTKFANQPH